MEGGSMVGGSHFEKAPEATMNLVVAHVPFVMPSSSDRPSCMDASSSKCR